MTNFLLFYWVMSIATMYFVHRITKRSEVIDAFGGLILLGILWPIVGILLLGAIIVKGPAHVWSNIKNAWMAVFLVLMLLPMGLKAEYYATDTQSIQSSLNRINMTLNRLIDPPKAEHKGMKKVVQYRLVCEALSTALSKDITILLSQGWELYGSASNNKYESCQAVTLTTWVKQK